MIELKKKITKNGQVRYYRASDFGLFSRNLPVPKAEAEAMLASGEAVLADYLSTITDFGRYCEDQRKEKEAEEARVAEENAKKIADFLLFKKRKDEEKKEKEKAEETAALIDRFQREVLPYIPYEYIIRVTEAAKLSNPEEFKGEFQRAIMAATLNQAKEKKFSR